MARFEHKKLAELIERLDAVPSDPEQYNRWIGAESSIELLRTNAYDDELIIYAGGRHSFVHSVVVSNSQLEPIDVEDLHHWSGNPYMAHAASYVYGGGRDDVWIERDSHLGAKSLNDAVQLVYARQFEGLTGDDATYFELSQDYAHLSGIHWRSEHKAYCRFDENGDFDPIVSMTRRSGSTDVSLITFRSADLDLFLAASDASLVRMFDFTRFRPGGFSSWPRGAETKNEADATFFYRSKVIPGYAGYVRGVQILRPREPRERIFARYKGELDDEQKQYASFITHDWRNNRVIEVSTDPKATTNYFAATEGKAFELSPAFFRPEVLLKYRADRDKYTVTERDISCRGAWYLRGFDVNDAGQVHAYICDLRNLPYQEQLYWRSYNEEPKTSISERALTNDFKGEWDLRPNPLHDIVTTARGWRDNPRSWWALREDKLLERLLPPHSGSRDDWAESFMDLSKLVVEGFQTKAIREKLSACGAPFEERDQSIALIERLAAFVLQLPQPQRLEGLRTVQLIRSKVKGHAGSSQASQISQQALNDHESYAAHFLFVAKQVAEEMDRIEQLLDRPVVPLAATEADG